MWGVVQSLQNVNNGWKLKIKKGFFVFKFHAIDFFITTYCRQIAF